MLKLAKIFVINVGEKIQRNNLSIEHKIPWLNSENPQGLFFDLQNIAFSHLSCNVGAARRAKASCGSSSAYRRGCRCNDCTMAKATAQRDTYTTEKRRERYFRTGH